MNLGQIKEATCSATVCAEKSMQFSNDTCNKYQITTPNRQLCFLAPLEHESGGLFYTEEFTTKELNVMMLPGIPDGLYTVRAYYFLNNAYTGNGRQQISFYE